MASATYSQAVNTSPYYSVQLRRFGIGAIVTLIAFITALVFLMPFGNMLLLSVKTPEQITASANGPIWPLEPQTFNYEGEDVAIYNVPTQDGVVHQWALVKKGRQTSQFIDPANPEAGL